LQVDERTLPELVHQAHQARLAVKLTAGVVEAELQAWAESHKGITEAANAAKDHLGVVEGALRSAIIADYERTGNKQPADGCGIRVSGQYNYDEKVALSWAADHGLCLKLDTKAFGDICKAESTRPDFVSAEETVTATIATDLSKFVEAQDVD
jgi:hypothetical protein